MCFRGVDAREPDSNVVVLRSAVECDGVAVDDAEDAAGQGGVWCDVSVGCAGCVAGLMMGVGCLPFGDGGGDDQAGCHQYPEPGRAVGFQPADQETR